MKIIDILNKINNGEDVPEKIKFDNTVFELEENKKEYSFQHENGDCETLLYRVMTTHFIDVLLEAEVEVIEENKEIEELNDNDIYDFNHLSLKINELVQAVNKLNKEREEK